MALIGHLSVNRNTIYYISDYLMGKVAALSVFLFIKR